MSNELYVYHQVQPNKYGLSYFTVIYDALDLESIGEQENFELMVNVSTINGRYLYPTRGNGFVLENVKEKCLSECRDEPELYDPRVCDLLPDGGEPKNDTRNHGKITVTSFLCCQLWYNEARDTKD